MPAVSEPASCCTCAHSTATGWRRSTRIAAAYLEWWLSERVDAEGWVVYKCTWESGEDGNPRLDPTGSGDADISTRVRPVELQATLAHAAGVLAFFAERARPRTLRAGEQLARRLSRERTRALFDAARGPLPRLADRRAAFRAECPEQPYWGIDAGRYSRAVADAAADRRAAGPEAEVWRHAMSALDAVAVVDLVAGRVGRRRRPVRRRRPARLRHRRPCLSRDHPSRAGQAGPTDAGSSPEFWPEDWRTYGGSDAYGWGATTANLLIRHLFGFKESRHTRLRLRSGARLAAVDAARGRALRRRDRSTTADVDSTWLRRSLSDRLRARVDLDGAAATPFDGPSNRAADRRSAMLA